MGEGGAQAARTSTVNSYQRGCADGRHQIISACDGDEALDTLADEPCWPDAVLLDYTLANETGDQVRSSPCCIGKLLRQAAWCISGSSCANCWVLAAWVSISKQLPMTARVLCTAHLVPTGVQEAAGRVWDDAGAHHHVHGVDSGP